MRHINAFLGIVGLAVLLLSGCGGGGGGPSGLATIRGSVRDANNNPVSGATVQVFANATPLATTTTDAAGNFLVRFPVSGTTGVVVTARSGSQTASTSAVVAPNTETQLDLRLGGTGSDSPPPPPF